MTQQHPAEFQRSVEIEYGLAKIWLQKRRLRRAMSGFRKVIAEEPTHIPSYLRLAETLTQLRRWAEVDATASAGLAVDPTQAQLHKAVITALDEQGQLEEAYARYRLVRRDHRPLEFRPADLLACVVARNEGFRFPYFLDYHRELGIDHFLVVDNGSTDGSIDFLLSQPDVYLWSSDFPFHKANFGSAWFELLLRRFGIGHWCATLDVDELLVFPGCETRSLVDFCRELDWAGKKAASGVLLDMYSDRPVAQTEYRPGEPFIPVCPYFDHQFFHRKDENSGPFKNQTFYWGGARERVFSQQVDFLVSKVPLLKYEQETILAGGQHWTNHPAQHIVAEQTCVLHFKYFSTFPGYVRQEIKRKEHSQNGLQYQTYGQRLAQDEAFTLYSATESVGYTGSQQLVELGIMQPVSEPAPIVFPPIEPVAGGASRPFWSVMLTVFDRLQYIERALSSVLAAAPTSAEMQIEVINDGADPAFKARLTSLVRDIAADRAQVYCHPVNLGQPHIFNLCINRARGRWVHILHDDDWVEPDFYQRLYASLKTAPAAVGAAFSRQRIIKGDGHIHWTSWLERETPGVIEDWLDRIAVDCRMQFAVVVRRSVFEQLGGFCAQALSAFDWEMWQRIAVHFPVWFEPDVLVNIGRDGSALTDRLERDGRQIHHGIRAAEIAQTYLPADRADELHQRAKENYALYALRTARRYLDTGDDAAALANMRAAATVYPSARVLKAISALLSKGNK